MKCTVCGHKMNRSRGNITYTSLPGVTLVGVEIHRCTHCDEQEVAIPRIEALHQALAAQLVRKEGTLAREEIRFLRKLLGWSGVDFARHFGVTPETVSRWESGRKTMGPVAERLLRLSVAATAPVDDYGVDDLGSIQEAPRTFAVTMKTTRTGWKSVAA